MDDIWTIELNLDDDFAKSTAYHIDTLQSTIRNNISHAENGKTTNRWVLIGLAVGIREANEKAKELRNLLCERNSKQPLSLNIAD